MKSDILGPIPAMGGHRVARESATLGKVSCQPGASALSPQLKLVGSGPNAASASGLQRVTANPAFGAGFPCIEQTNTHNINK